MAAETPRVYVSYNWKVEEKTRIVEKLESLCKKRGIELVRDKTHLGHGERISEFMTELSKADHVITVFSNEYFKSRYCMVELLKIYHRGDFDETVHPILADDLNLDNDDNKNRFIDHWEDKLKNSKAKTEGRDPTSVTSQIEKQKVYKKILLEIDALISSAADKNITPLAELEEKEYTQLLDQIKSPGIDGSPNTYAAVTKEDQYYLDDLKEGIEESLENSKELRINLIKIYRLQKESEVQDLTKELIVQCEKNITTLIRNITTTTRDQLENLENEKAYDKANKLIKHAEKLVTLFSLFDIKTEQAEQLHSQPFNMTLTHEAPGSAELALAKRLNSFPKYRISENNPEIVGKFAASSSELETGIKSSSAVDYYEKRFWKLAFPNFSTDKFDIDRLSERIGQELEGPDRKKKNYHIVVTLNKSEDEGYPLADENVRNELIKRFDGKLPIIILKNAEKTGLFVSSDRKLMEEIYNFFDQIGPFQARMQDHD